MDDPAAVTLASYEAASVLYRDAAGPCHGLWLAFVAEFAGRVAGGHVLEVGSGPGREARLLEQRGVTVARSDAAAAFVAMMAADGHEARQLDVRTDPLGGPYDGAFANAVLLHLDRAEVQPVLARVREVVRPGGTLALTMKEGDGEEWHSRKLGLPRRFVYWREAELRDACAAAGWHGISIEHVAGRAHPVEPWLYLLATAG